MNRICALILASLLVPAFASARVVDRVVAVVNDEAVTWSELEDGMSPMLRKIETINDPIERENQRQKTLRRGLDDLIGQKLVSQEGIKLRVTITGDEVTTYLERVKSSQKWDDERLRMYLTSQGIGLPEFRQQVRQQLLRQKVIRSAVGARIRLSDSDLREYYKEKLTKANADYEIEAAHIALPVAKDASPTDEAAVRQQAAEILARAKGGEDFAALAKQYSRAPGAENGGRLGVFRRGLIDPTLEKALFAIEAGEVAGPVRSAFGYHVVKTIAKKRVPPAPFAESKDALRRELQDKKLQEELGKWIEELKKKAFIDIRL